MFLGKLVSQATHKMGWISHFLFHPFPCEHHRHLLEHRDTTLKECARLRVWIRPHAKHSLYSLLTFILREPVAVRFSPLTSAAFLRSQLLFRTSSLREKHEKGVWQSKQLVLTKTHPLTSARHERKQIPNYAPKIPIAHCDLILVCTRFPPSLRKSWLYILACSTASDPTAHSNLELPPQWPSGNSCWRSVSSPSLGQEGGMHNVHSSMTTIWKSSIETHGKLTILEMHVCLEPDIRSPLLWLWMCNYMFPWCAVCWHIDKYHC